MRGRWTLALLITSGWCAAPPGEEARQILARRCVACHSPRVKTAGLDLTSRDTALRGGTKGPALVPGAHASSLLIARVASGEMPPAKPLPEAEIDTLRQWVASGAPGWTQAIAENRSGPEWWAYQPLRAGDPPPGESANGIDWFVKARLRERAWQPAPPAGRRALIRRATFGLTGLPPTPEEIDAFLADSRPDAYERLIDRLLASPRYGEHWARHWLDTVRYSESEGFERDWLRDNAWPYRDYVIRSFNSDKPYAQFVGEQIAGDVMEPSTRDGLAATSLLALGPFDAVGLTSAVAQERDQVRADQMEDIVSVVSQTFLGLTVNCARCHDHKFDPIPQRDYYRLKAVFDGVWQPTVGDELKAGGRPLLTAAEAASYQKHLKEAEAKIRRLEARLAALDRAARTAPPPAAAPLPRPVALWTLDTDARDDVGQLHAGKLAESAGFAEGRLALAEGKTAVTVATQPLDFDLREKTLEAWIYAREKPEKGVTLLRIRNKSGFRGAAFDGIHYAGGKKRQWENTSTVRFRTAELDGPADDTPAGGRIHVAITYAADGEIRIYRNGELYGRPYRPDAGSPHGRLQTYGKGDAIVELSSGNGLELEQARIFASALPPAGIEHLYKAGVENASPAPGPERIRLASELADARRQWSTIDAGPAKAFAAEVHPAEPTRFLIRGDVTKPGDVVAPAGVSLLPGLPGDLNLPPLASDADRRLRFANWLTSDENPLFARVIVNRVWHYHFGAGLVDSPNDFGFNGGQPSHPELLDWLAAQFLRSGGSIKRLQKLILTSQTYRQSSFYQSGVAEQDSSVRLLWRFQPQRLPAEAVRDAMLAASGALNTEMFGPSFRPFRIVKNTGSYHSYDSVDSGDPAFQRRTVYRMNVNSGGDPLLEALDCPLPSMKTPKRSATTTSLQALSLMNNPFVNRMAKALAVRVTAESENESGRIQRAYLLTLGRPPREEEAKSAATLAETAGLEALCWSLFNLSEFVYVE